MGNIKEIKVRNRNYCFFDDKINITNLDPNLLKIDKKLYTNIDAYYIECISTKDSDCVKLRV